MKMKVKLQNFYRTILVYTDLELNNAESAVESNSQLNIENHMPEEEGVTGVKTEQLKGHSTDHQLTNHQQ